MTLRSVALAAAAGAAAASPGCLDPSGAPVDWWAIFKNHGGVDYAIITSSDANVASPLQLAGAALDSEYGPLGYTLAQVVDDRSGLARVQWNDELPEAAGGSRVGADNATASTYGHTKGLFATDASGGFLLVHSLPKAFTLTGAAAGFWGGASTTYGQSFLCLTLPVDQVEEAAYAYQYNDIDAYDSYVPAALSGALPNTVALVAGQRRSGTYSTQLTTAGGAGFTVFAKSGSAGVDLYEDVVQPALGIDAWVETWRRSPAMATYCRNATSGFAWDSMNVQQLRFQDAAGNEVAWKYTQDHSKWLVTAPNGTSASAAGVTAAQPKWLCIGDINRMSSQWARGGGTVCTQHDALYDAMVASVVLADSCAD